MGGRGLRAEVTAWTWTWTWRTQCGKTLAFQTDGWMGGKTWTSDWREDTDGYYFFLCISIFGKDERGHLSCIILEGNPGRRGRLGGTGVFVSCALFLLRIVVREREETG